LKFIATSVRLMRLAACQPLTDEEIIMTHTSTTTAVGTQ